MTELNEQHTAERNRWRELIRERITRPLGAKCREAAEWYGSLNDDEGEDDE